VREYALHLLDAWFAGGHYDLARSGCAQLAEAATALGDAQSTALALRRWAQACIEQDDFEAAGPLLERAMSAARRAESDTEVAGVLYLMARAAAEQGQYEQALAWLDACGAIYAALGDREGQIKTLCQSAGIAYDRGDLQAAQEICLAALALEPPADRSPIAVFRLLADIAIEQDDYAAARQWCERALSACEETGEQNERAPLHYLNAVVARCTGNLGPALQEARQAQLLAARMGDTGFEALALYEQSRAHLLLEDLPAAEALGQAALAHMRRAQAHFNAVYALNHLGHIALRSQGPEQAAQRWQAALAVAQERRHPLAETLQGQLDALGAR
jgi:tetratricopeptide (TPR) repeat protein